MPHCRCSRCESRRTLARKPDEYIRVPRCLRCGHNHWRLDKYRAKHERGPKSKKCDPSKTGCHGYSFIHRHGSGYCDHNPKLTIDDLKFREDHGRWA